MQWITDFSERIQQLQRVTAAGGAKGLKVSTRFIVDKKGVLISSFPFVTRKCWRPMQYA